MSEPELNDPMDADSSPDPSPDPSRDPGAGSGADRPDLPEVTWASAQLRLAVVGGGLSLLGLIAAAVGVQPGIDGFGFRLMAVIAIVVLASCCGVNAWSWLAQLGRWRTGSDDGYRQRSQVSIAAHVISYAAVLVGMYGTLEGSALAGWSSQAGTLHGIAFILIIFGQIIGGTQYLRRSGPPGTIPTYLRRLNAKVQSLR